MSETLLPAEEWVQITWGPLVYMNQRVVERTSTHITVVGQHLNPTRRTFPLAEISIYPIAEPDRKRRRQ